MRKTMAIAGVPGLIAGIYIFVASFFGMTMDKLGAKTVLLHLGLFALGTPLVFADGLEKLERENRRMKKIWNP